MRDMVSPYIPEAINRVVAIMQNADKDADRLAAAKLLISYYAGQPPQFIEGSFETTGITVTVKE